MHEFFRKAARSASSVLGSAWAFTAAVVVVLVWAALGPVYHFSDTWQLVINTGTTIVTFLMVFLIQNTQNRDSKAVHLKLDELLRVTRAARNTLVDLEDMSEAELEELNEEFKRVHEIACEEGDDSARRHRDERATGWPKTHTKAGRSAD
jgi:low affinity Fe/Cu permease